MAYQKIKSYQMSEEELRKLWDEEYCCKDIYTFDGILVQFFRNMFDHCFYESSDFKKKDKSILSLNRLEKMLWIKDCLQDPDAVMRKGWNKGTKSYDDDRRLTLVKGNYIVVILVFNSKKARFVTAYEVNDDHNLEAIKNAPVWS